MLLSSRASPNDEWPQAFEPLVGDRLNEDKFAQHDP